MAGGPETGSTVEPPILRIRLLGELDLRVGDEGLPALDSARAESLLAHLLVHRGAPQARERLAFLLWPDSSEPQARTNLRHVLHNLRRALPHVDRFLDVTPRTLRWRTDAPFWLDVDAFEAALARSDDAAAVAAYGGDLLEGCYDDWLAPERERLRELLLDALERLARLGGAEAIAYGERLLAHDPLREATYRLLMRLHDARGDRARALRVYHACAAALERELGVEPSAATREAYEALLPGAPEAAGSEQAVLVGRASERARLTQLWRASERGRAQLVLVTGEPGIGKTRLVEELRAWCAHRGAATAEARSYPAEGALAYGPVAAWLRSDALAARRVRLDRGRLGELARVLPEVPGLPRPEPLPESEQRQRLFDALARAILAAAGPLLLVADDLHWADRETLQFLHYLVRSAPGARLLVAATARREDMDRLRGLVTGLAALERLEEIELGRLSRQETAVLADRFAGRALDADRLFAETEGNPLFIVETLRAGSLSPRVQAVIQARLAQLSAPARDLVGVAAAVGREFTADVLARAGEAGEAELVRGLDELWRRRIIRERGPDAYDFSHDKIREAAYLALAPARRRRTHLLVARALEALHADEPGQVALHYDRAGAAQQAVGWYGRAAEAAERMHANVEAIHLLERALALAGPDRELDVIDALIAPLAVVEGYGSGRLAELQRRALEVSGPEPRPALLRSLALTHLAGSDFGRSRRYAEQLRARGERDGDGVLLVESDYVLGVSAFWQGELEAARRHFEAAAERYRPEHRVTHIVRYGLDPKVVCLSRLANTLGFLGEPAAARRVRDDALAAAEEAAHGPSTATAFAFAALLALDLGDVADVRRYADALAAACHGVKPAELMAEALAGYVDVLDGRPESGVARARRALDEQSAIDHAPGSRAGIARVVLAACVAAGDTGPGLAAADVLLAARTGAPLWEAEARRLRTELEERSRNAALA